MKYEPLIRLRFSQIPLLRSLPDAENGELIARVKIRRYEPGETVVREGEKPGSFLLLLSGAVQIGRVTRDGEAVVYRQMTPPAAFGYGLLADRAFTADITASEPALIGALPAGMLRRTLAGHPEALLEAVVYLTNLVDTLSTENLELKTLDLKERVKRSLDRLSNAAGECRMSHEELSGVVGANRTNTSRALKELERAGFLSLGRRRITLSGTRQASDRLAPQTVR